MGSTDLTTDEFHSALVPTAVLRLTPQQRLLVEALFERDNSIGNMYLGALYVLADNNNPDRAPLAAHNLREMLQRLRKHLGVEAPAHQERLGDKVDGLASRWKRAQKRSRCRGGNEWTGTIDGALARFISEVEQFFGWYEKHRPRMRAEVAQILRSLDKSPVPLPAPIEELRVEEWQRYHDFFVTIAHHGRHVAMEDFMAWCAHLEQFLVDRLRPRTFTEINELDAIIREGEQRDN